MVQENFLAQSQLPPFPLPLQIMGSEIGSFAYNTVVQRLPAIAQRVIAENDFPPPIVENLETLIRELPNGEVRSLNDTAAPDIIAWNRYIQPYQGNSWLDIPWYFAEAYFYRRILEATHYFIPGKWQGYDPFEGQKSLGIATSMDSIKALSALINQWIYAEPDGNIQWNKTNFLTLLSIDLWGNRVDLSLWPAQEGDRSLIDIHREQPYILVDDSDAIASKVASFTGARIDFIIDNAGFELVGDLCLVDFLLATHAAQTIYLHLKSHPTFVSDATIKDIHQTLKTLGTECNPEVRVFASRLQDYISDGRLQLCEDLFWTSPLAFWEMPEALRLELAKSDLTFVKGDANYRRLLGDRHWPFTTPFPEIVSYFPSSMVALRTLKAELASGLQPNQVETLNQKDPQWLTNGRWGVIQGNFRF
jgi:uncharacterized protein with ATP-grasp and redox domains